MMGMAVLAAGATSIPDWVAPIAKVVIGGLILIAVINFALSGGGPKGRD